MVCLCSVNLLDVPRYFTAQIVEIFGIYCDQMAGEAIALAAGQVLHREGFDAGNVLQGFLQLED
jgi:hypothetical protein